MVRGRGLRDIYYLSVRVSLLTPGWCHWPFPGPPEAPQKGTGRVVKDLPHTTTKGRAGVPVGSTALGTETNLSSSG